MNAQRTEVLHTQQAGSQILPLENGDRTYCYKQRGYYPNSVPIFSDIELNCYCTGG